MENNLSKGLVKNYENNLNQPQNSYSFALALTNELNSQEKVNEPGNTKIYELPLNYEVIGSITYNEKTFIFSTDDINNEIGVVKEDKYTKILNEKLGFKKDHKISGTARVRNNCCLTLYFRDSLNRDMYLEVDNIADYYDASNKFLKEKLFFNKKFTIPQIDNITVLESGGLLDLGSYVFVFEVLDNNKNVIYKTEPTLPIRIYPQTTDETYIDIKGGYNIPLFSEENGGKPKVRKAIQLELSKLDKTYTYIRASLILYQAGDGVTPIGYTDPLLLGISDNLTYLFTGVNNTFESRDVDSLIIPNIKYDKSEYLEQVQGRLIKANVKEKEVDFSTFQAFASKIKTNYSIKEIPKYDASSLGDSKNPNSAYMPYMGDEVYAANIEYIFNDGYVSPSFHIPGTCLDTYKTIVLRNLTSKVAVSVNYCADEFNDPYVIDIYYTLNGVADNITIKSDSVYTFDLFAFDPLVDVYTVFVETRDRYGTLLPNCASYLITDNPNPTLITSGYTAADIEATIKIWNADLDPFYNQTDYAGLADKDKLKKWEVYNTASRISNRKGYMAYYEGKSKYPLLLDCNDKSIWGVDSCGEPLAGRQIRHHKFPDNKIEPIVSGDNIRLKGFLFSNIEYPHPDIVGHRFTVGVRDEYNRTIIDKGVMGAMVDSTTAAPSGQKYIGFTWTNPNVGASPTYKYLFSPKTQHLKGYLNAQYIKNEGEYERDTDTLTLSDNFDGPGKNTSDVDNYLEVRNKKFKDDFLFDDPKVNIKIKRNSYLNRFSRKEMNGRPVVNLSQTNDIAVTELTRNFAATDYRNLQFVSYKVKNSPFDNLFNIKTRRVHNNVLTSLSKKDEFEIYGGDTYINDLSIANSFTRKFYSGHWDYLILAASIFAVAVVSVASLGTLTGPALAIAAIAIGAGFVAGQAFALAGEIIKQYSKGEYLYVLDDTINYDLHDATMANKPGDAVSIACEFLQNVWVESEINVGLKHSGGSLPYDTVGSSDLTNYFKNKCLYWDDKTNTKRPGWAAYTVSLPEYYNVNPDYMILDKYHSNGVLPQTYDYCLKCRNQYPYRLVYSNKSFNEDIADGYLNFAANNYIDLPSNKGKILALKYKENKLFVFTELTTYILQPNPQILQATNTDVYLGTGDFLSIPPQELIQTDLGFAGITNQYSLYNSKHGMTWVTNNKEIINYSGGVELISLPMELWFKQNLLFDTKLNYNNRKEILYLSQRGKEKENFTLSYDYRSKTWLSYHPYLPDNWFNNSDFFYTTQGNQLLQHQNTGNYNMFNGVQYPTIIETIDTSLITQSLDAIFYIAKLSNPDSNFTHLMCYTENHNTGILELKNVNQHYSPYGNILNDDITKTIIKTDENYKISNLYDLSISSENTSTKWSDLQPYLQEYGYIDLVPININKYKSQYDYANLKDKWIAVRLFYKPLTNNDKLNFNLIALNNEKSIR